MTNKEKLIEILRTIPEIKKDLEELRFWTLLDLKWNPAKIIYTEWEFAKIEFLENSFNKRISTLRVKNLYLNEYEKENWYSNSLKIIWNPIHRHHLIQYILIMVFSSNVGCFKDIYGKIEIEFLSSSSSLNNQTEEVLGQIYNFLKEKSEYKKM